jgi:hypothetical protein
MIFWIKRNEGSNILLKTLLKILIYNYVNRVTSTECIYEHLQLHQISTKGKTEYKKRSSAVEPVFEILKLWDTETTPQP